MQAFRRFVFFRWKHLLMKMPSSGLCLSVTPGAISLFATPSGVTTWTVNETLTLTCNGPVGTVEGNTQVHWLLRYCTGMFFGHTRGRQHTGTLTSQVLYRDVLQSDQGLQYTGESFSLYMKLFRHIRGCNTQVNHFLCCMKLFSQIRGSSTQVSFFYLLSSESVQL